MAGFARQPVVAFLVAATILGAGCISADDDGEPATIDTATGGQSNEPVAEPDNSTAPQNATLVDEPTPVLPKPATGESAIAPANNWSHYWNVPADHAVLVWIPFATNQEVVELTQDVELRAAQNSTTMFLQPTVVSRVEGAPMPWGDRPLVRINSPASQGSYGDAVFSGGSQIAGVLTMGGSDTDATFDVILRAKNGTLFDVANASFLVVPFDLTQESGIGGHGAGQIAFTRELPVGWHHIEIMGVEAQPIGVRDTDITMPGGRTFTYTGTQRGYSTPLGGMWESEGYFVAMDEFASPGGTLDVTVNYAATQVEVRMAVVSFAADLGTAFGFTDR